MASAAAAAETTDSSRQTGVEIRRASSACWAGPPPSGCSTRSRPKASRRRSGVGEGVGGVGVHLQRNVGAEPVPHRGDRLDVPARADLQLDPHVALVEIAGHGVERRRDRVVDADRDPAGDGRPSDPEVFGEGAPQHAAQRRGPRSPAPPWPSGDPDRVEDPGDGLRRELTRGEEHRRKPAPDDVGRAADILAGVQRLGPGDALDQPTTAVPSTSARSSRMRDVPDCLGAEGGRERADQRHLGLVQGQVDEPHGPPGRTRRSLCRSRGRATAASRAQSASRTATRQRACSSGRVRTRVSASSGMAIRHIWAEASSGRDRGPARRTRRRCGRARGGRPAAGPAGCRRPARRPPSGAGSGRSGRRR